jgi:ATPase subunit of ABC transporter with duplicated ATPase domains
MGNKGLWSALEEREVIYSKPEMTDEDGIRLGELEGIVGEEDGYEADSNAAILLQGLDIPDELHNRQMSELQGGQKVRVLLAQALFGNPDALFLDEPTNYLDLDSIHWLENFLNRYNGTVITISHDRHFLNSVCTHIADIDYETIITYTGGYDDMVLQKTQIRSRIESQNEQREKKIAQLNEFIARFSAGTRSSQVNSRKKEVERLQTTELARSNIQRPYLRFDMLRPSGKHVLEFEHVNKSYTQPDGATEHVIRNFSASVLRGDKVVLVGRNGQGKSTMLKALLANSGLDEANKTDIDSGEVKWGHEAQIGYFAQDHTASIPKGTTAAEWLHSFDPKAAKEDIRGLLGQMLFRGEEGLKKTEALSGGEAARLLFCKLMLQKPNILVLDEPTNHLDLESIMALNTALQKYEGTVFLVTHDQDLIEEVGTRIWHFEGGPADFHITDHKGPYEEYEQQLALATR